MTRLPVGSKFRSFFERLRGVKIGKNVFIGGGNVLDRVHPDLITLEDYATITNGVNILTHTFTNPILEPILGPSAYQKAPVIIKRGAWLAVNSVILPGVTVGECSVVSAGAIVSKDVPPYCIVAGNPARVVKRFDENNVNI